MQRIGLGLLSAWATTAAVAAPAPIVIATGPVSGFAFPLGGEICRLYEQASQNRARCSVAVTEGSADNLARLRNGEITLAIVQSDIAADAVTASGSSAGSPPFKELRSLIGFYPDALTVLVVSDGPVKQIDDLKDKRIAVGEPGIHNQLFADFLEGLGWNKADLGGIVEMPRSEQISALCGGKVAAIALTAPHPNGFVRAAMAACKVTILDLAGPGLDSSIAAHPAYGFGRIDLGLYGLQGVAQSFGPRAVLVTTTKLESDIAVRLATAMFGRIADLKAAHPALAELDQAALASSAGLGAERDPAIVKYLNDNKISTGTPTQ